VSGYHPIPGGVHVLTVIAACSFGATIICVDVVVRLFPGQKQFRIQDSNAFLGCSLSLSFGVMVGFSYRDCLDLC